MKTTQFKFIKYTWLWFTISFVMLFIGIGAMVNNKINTGQFIRMGIDFTGGTLMEIQLDKNDKDYTSDIKNAVNSVSADSVSQITITNKGTYIIQSKHLSNEEHDKIKTAVTGKTGKFEEIRFNTIGPKIGSSLKSRAVIALLVAMAAIVLYLAYAFRKVPKRVSPWRFGICAIIALIHDVLITIGAFALLNYEVDAFFITALLTVVGFSVHDTIVVFDRIRENLKYQERDDTFAKVADISLNQTLHRSINTSLSTLITLVALFFLGAESIHLFVFALIIGITVGTYSSIFIASPLLTIWQERSRVR